MLRWSSHARVRSAARDYTIYFRFYDKSSMFLEDLEKRCRSTRLLLRVIQSGLFVSKVCVFLKTPRRHPPKSFLSLKKFILLPKRPHNFIRVLGEEVGMTQKHQQRKHCFLPRFQCLSLKLVNFKHNLRKKILQCFKKESERKKIFFSHLNKQQRYKKVTEERGLFALIFCKPFFLKKNFFSQQIKVRQRLNMHIQVKLVGCENGI